MPAASGAQSFTGPAASDESSGWIAVFPDSVNSTLAYALFYNPYNPSYSTQWWRSTSYIPNVDRNRGAASLNGKYYAFGGWSEPSSSYDSWLLELTMGGVGSSDTWKTNLPALPTARLSMASAVAGGSLYVIGGYDGAGLRDVERYDPAANTWTKRYALFKVRMDAAAAAVNGKVYLIGGNDVSVAPTTTVFVYDPGVDT
jgi:N-acetylneuraminic acid mutarotase